MGHVFELSRQAERANPIVNFETDEAGAHAATSLAVATVEWNDVDKTMGWGRDESLELAKLKALGEAVERYAFRRPVPMRSCRYADLVRPVRPESIIRYSEGQYASGAIPFRPFNSSEAHWWVDGRSLFTGDQVSLLADCVLSPTVFGPDYQDKLYTAPSSSGCASGLLLEDAILRGAIEVVERDAFMRHWLRQAGGSDVLLETLPGSILVRIASLRLHGVEVGVRCLLGGVYPSWLVWAQHQSLHFTAIGSSSGVDAEAALKSALDELENGVLQNMIGVHDAVAMRASDVIAPEDHSAFYATKENYKQADAFLKSIASTIDWLTAEKLFAGSIGAFLRILEQERLSVYWVDLSLRQASKIFNDASVHTVRVVIPGLVPITFGNNRLPLGMGDHKGQVVNHIHPLA